MADVTNLECERRREKIGLLMAQGIRSVMKIADELKCSRITVMRDMVIIKRRRKISKSYEEQQEEYLLESVRGYMADIERLEELIRKAEADKGIELEIQADGSPVTDEMKQSSITKRKQTTRGINYNSIANLYQLKLKARRELAELYDLLEPESKKNLFKELNINITNVTNNNKTNINLDLLSDDDLIRFTKTFEGRGAPTV
jgi:hypothetical protein